MMNPCLTSVTDIETVDLLNNKENLHLKKK